MQGSFYKICFRTTAIGNIIAAFLALASMEMHLEMFYGDVGISPLLSLYHYGFWVFVLTMGIAYWALSNNPGELKIIALIGAIGKLFLVAAWIHLFLSGHAKPMILVGIVYDAFFGIVLGWFYLSNIRAPERP